MGGDLLGENNSLWKQQPELLVDNYVGLRLPGACRLKPMIQSRRLASAADIVARDISLNADSFVSHENESLHCNDPVFLRSIALDHSLLPRLPPDLSRNVSFAACRAA